MARDWLKLLRDQVKERGQAAVAKELCCSRATISLLCNGKYPASTDKMRRKVLALYGSEDGLVHCPVLGPLAPASCTENLRLASELGFRGGNPQTLRLRKACLNCNKRS